MPHRAQLSLPITHPQALPSIVSQAVKKVLGVLEGQRKGLKHRLWGARLHISQRSSAHCPRALTTLSFQEPEDQLLTPRKRGDYKRKGQVNPVPARSQPLESHSAETPGSATLCHATLKQCHPGCVLQKILSLPSSPSRRGAGSTGHVLHLVGCGGEIQACVYVCSESMW